MNVENYTDLETSKKLVAAGIVLETDRQWYVLKNGDVYLSGSSVPMIQIVEEYPAASFAELWRELPETIKQDEQIWWKRLVGKDGVSYASYFDNAIHLLPIQEDFCVQRWSPNPANALAELLIWVRKAVK